MSGSLPRAARSTSRARRRSTPAALLALFTALLLALTGCGSDDDDSGSAASASSEAAAFPVTVTADNGEVTIEEQPESIVSMSATATEMLFDIGAGDQVVAVDETSNYPAEVPTTELSAYTPNAEAIIGYAPDLVVLSDDINGIVDSLETLDVPVVQLSAVVDLEGSYDQLRLLGEATGRTEAADDVVDDVRDRIDAALHRGAGAAEPPLRAAGAALTRASHAVEHLPLLRRGEDPATALDRPGPPWGTVAVGLLVVVGGVALAARRRR